MYGVVYCTVPNQEEAKRIAKILVEEKLAACVNIVPKIISIYSWKGDIVEDEEYLLIIKTQEKSFKNMKNKIISTHPYDVPEIIFLPIKMGYDKYLDWIKDETKCY